MKPRKHAELIKAWADGAEIEYKDKYLSQWTGTDRPCWHESTTYRVKPPVRTAAIVDGFITMEDGTTVNLKWIQGLLNEAFVAHGHQDFATGANEMAKVTGMKQGPHEEWYVTTDEGDQL